MSDILVRIRSRTALFPVGFFTICLNGKCLSKDETGHLLKSPSKSIPAFGYLLRARSRVVCRWSIKASIKVSRQHRQSNRRSHDKVYGVSYKST